MLRSVLAILAGYVVMAVIVMAGTAAAAAAFGLPLAPNAGAPVPTPGAGYLAANLLVSALGAVAGGWVAAHVARRRPLTHAAVLAALLVAAGLATLGRPQPGQPAWYPPVLLVLGPAGALLGGLLRSARRVPTPSPAGR
jgi:hypothetical protein